MTEKQHGGKREGAGRKPKDRNAAEVPKHRGFYCTDTQWQKIKTLAESAGMSYSQYILQFLPL